MFDGVELELLACLLPRTAKPGAVKSPKLRIVLIDVDMVASEYRMVVKRIGKRSEEFHGLRNERYMSTQSGISLH